MLEGCVALAHARHGSPVMDVSASTAFRLDPAPFVTDQPPLLSNPQRRRLPDRLVAGRASSRRHSLHRRGHRRADLRDTLRPLGSGKANEETDMRRFIWATLFSLLAVPSGFAQQRSAASLDRPDPKIGEGFETVMIDQFKAAFGINNAEAKCLVYEVMTEVRSTGKYDGTPVDVARKVGSRCALALKDAH
jgi:hypothetical protein